MPNLTHPILHDCARVIGRHPGIGPEYKQRLLDGLAAIDKQLEDEVPQVEPKKKGAK